MPGNLQFKFQDEQIDFDPKKAGNGRHLAASDLDGAQVHVDIHEGHITGVHGEKHGKPVQTFYITGTAPADGSESGHEGLMASQMTCYLCACSGNSCTCRRIPCW
jgi:hypothetical protein